MGIKKLRIAILFSIISGFLIALSIPKISVAQQNSTIRVVVIAANDGTPVAGANVLLLNPGSKKVMHAGATSSDGLHSFNDIKAGRYILKISFVGYQTYENAITVVENDNEVKRVVLPVSVSSLEELIVEDERDVTTGEAGLRRISRQDISRVPSAAAGGDLASYLQSVPGVISTGDRGGELNIRGGTPSQNRVLVDNLPIIKPFHISNLFSAFPEETIQNVDLYAGGFGAEYSDATSAILDVRLRPGNYIEHSGSGSVSPYLSTLQIEGPIEEGSQSFMIMGRKSTIDQTSSYLTGNDENINFYDITARYSFRGDNYTCNVTGIRTQDRGEINPIRDFELKWTNTVLGTRCLGYSENLNNPIELTAGYSHYSNTSGSVNQTERLSKVRQFFFAFDHKEKLFGIPIDYGLELNFRSYKAELAEQFTSFESFDIKLPVVHLYAATVWDVNKNLTIEPSLGSTATILSGPTFEPRLRMAYRPDGSGNQELSIAAGRYYQISSGITDERDAGNVFTVWKPNEGETALPSALHGILGYQQKVGNYFKAKMEGYIKDHRNIPVSKWTPVAQLEIETALADGFTYGFDFVAEFNKNPFYLSLGYGYSNVEYEAVSGDLGAWIEEPVFSYSPAHDQRHKFNTTASYSLAGFTVNTRWEFGSGRPYTQVYGFDLFINVPIQNPFNIPGTARTLFSRPYGERLPVYHRLDVSVEKSFQLSTQLSMDVQAGAINLYDRNNIFFFDANSLERVNQTSLLPYISIRAKIN